MKSAAAKKLQLRPASGAAKASGPLLQLNALTKEGEGNFILKDITFTLGKREKIAIAGETGAGKSTVLKLIAGLLQPDGGALMYQGTKVMGPDDHLVPGHPGIAYLSQHFELQKSLRVEQVLAYSNVLSADEAQRLYDVCQITHVLKRRTDQLSGGEKQRVAICRLLTSRPGLLLMDEPFSHLDMMHKITLKEVIDDIGDRLGITCMLVSHDPSDTLPWADKIVVMREGRMVQMDTPQGIYKKPVDEYTAGLFGKCNWIERKEMRLFARLKPIVRMKDATDHRKILVRPEQFKIVSKREGALRARVQRVMFYGGFCEAEVLLSKKLLTIRTANAGLSAGDFVYLAVGKEPLWKV